MESLVQPDRTDYLELRDHKDLEDLWDSLVLMGNQEHKVHRAMM